MILRRFHAVLASANTWYRDLTARFPFSNLQLKCQAHPSLCSQPRRCHGYWCAMMYLHDFEPRHQGFECTATRRHFESTYIFSYLYDPINTWSDQIIKLNDAISEVLQVFERTDLPSFWWFVGDARFVGGAGFVGGEGFLGGRGFLGGGRFFAIELKM